jgi:hypothetical protein
MAAAWLGYAGISATPFLGQLSMTPADFLGKAVVLALAVPVLLLSRDEFAEVRFHVLLLSSLYGVCLMLASDSFHAFVGLEPCLAGVRAGRPPPRSTQRGGRAQIWSWGAATACLFMGLRIYWARDRSRSPRSPPRFRQRTRWRSPVPCSSARSSSRRRWCRSAWAPMVEAQAFR